MTLKEFTDMAHSCNSPITVTLFSDIESEEEFRQTKNAGLVLLKFQYTYQTAVVLTSKFVMPGWRLSMVFQKTHTM